MDQYHIWFDLKDSHRDVEFARNLDAFLGHLEQDGLIVGHRLSRRKLGFGPSTLGEFHVVVETNDLAQLDQAFGTVVPRTDPIEKLHRAVYGMITNTTFALYRDFPDPSRTERTGGASRL